MIHRVFPLAAGLVLGLSMPNEGRAQQEFYSERTWESASGSSITARVKSHQNGTFLLVSPANKSKHVKPEQLSQADRDYLDGWLRLRGKHWHSIDRVDIDGLGSVLGEGKVSISPERDGPLLFDKKDGSVKGGFALKALTDGTLADAALALMILFPGGDTVTLYHDLPSGPSLVSIRSLFLPPGERLKTGKCRGYAFVLFNSQRNDSLFGGADGKPMVSPSNLLSLEVGIE